MIGGKLCFQMSPNSYNFRRTKHLCADHLDPHQLTHGTFRLRQNIHHPLWYGVAFRAKGVVACIYCQKGVTMKGERYVGVLDDHL